MLLSIRFNDISYSYNGSDFVFNKLYLNIPPDKSILISGENGVGKSTLVKIAAGQLSPQTGFVNYMADGIVLAKKDIYQEISFLRQNTEDNILLPNAILDLKSIIYSQDISNEDSFEVIEKTLIEWELHDKRYQPIWELSAGELKALTLAGISLTPERYWILDEPFASLDDKHRGTLMDLLLKKQSYSRGMIIISHQNELIKPIIDETWNILPGGIVNIL